MRFLALEAHSYGPLRQKNWELEANVFVVYGPNEAGKSSFHSALRTVLYGFERPKRSDHPLSRLGPPGEDLELRAKLQLENGETLWVERKLMSYAKLTVRDEQGQELRAPQRNEALEEIQSIPASLFDAVYSLTANDTTMQTDEVHEHIQELLLGETGLRGARPIGEVRRELATDRDQLWRPDGRGKPRAKQLDEELRAAERDLRELRRKDKELREARETRAALQPELDRLQRVGRSLRLHGERLRYAAQWNRYRSMLREVEAVRARLAALPAETRREVIEDPARLRSGIERQNQALAPHRERLLRPAPALTPEQERWQQTEPALRAFLKAWPDYRDLRKDVQQAQAEVARRTEELTADLQHLGLSVSAAKTLNRLQGAPLQAAAKEWEAQRLGHQTLAQTKTPSPWWMLFAALAIGASIGWWLAPAYAPWWLGGLLVAFATCVALLWRPNHLRDVGPPPPMPVVWQEALAALELETDSYASPAALNELVGHFDRYQTRRREARLAQQRKQELEQELAVATQPWNELAAALQLEGSPERAHADVASRWESVQAAVAEVQQAQQQYEQSEQFLREHEAALADDEARLERIEQWLQTAFPDRYPHGEAMEALKEFRDAQAVVEAEGQELRGHELYTPEWETSQGPPSIGDEAWQAWVGEGEDPRQWQAVDCETALQRLERELHEKHVRLGALDEVLKDREGMRLAQAFEYRNQIRSAQRETLEERDRLALLGRLLERAEALHREKHQPDVLARAGQYLERITDGRYLGLQYPPDPVEEGAERPSLQVHSAAHGWCAVGKPLSRGTQEQIYLALRLGTLDYLDRGRETLPLVLDEALVHWDEDRRRSLYTVLRELAHRRQVILFTCHESFAREVEQDLGARVIELVRSNGAPSPD